ncbi:MAG TPA: ADP-glyceromanno-heptose 6-epimerase [Bacteroidia bacterium]
MIVITGAAGFIGSCLVSKLNNESYNDLILVDDFTKAEKENNWKHLHYSELVDRNDFFNWVEGKGNRIQFIFHIGARTDTTEFNYDILKTLNVDYSKKLWELCVKEGIPLVYASSAATYGMGEWGFTEDLISMSKLKPLNPYGQSKLEFDLWALDNPEKPYFWAGLKFFNVYGPNEYHKERMASVVYHAFNQINKYGSLKLFRSHHPDYKDGEQKRDFVYVKDVVDVLFFLMINRKNSGIYNLGSGKAHTFKELAQAVFRSMDKAETIEFIDTPEDIRDKYQYFTEADMNKLKSIGYTAKFADINEGVNDYVRNHLLKKAFY